MDQQEQDPPEPTEEDEDRTDAALALMLLAEQSHRRRLELAIAFALSLLGGGSEDAIRRAVTAAIVGGAVNAFRLGATQAQRDLAAFAAALGVSIPARAAKLDMEALRARADTAGRVYAEAWTARLPDGATPGLWIDPTAAAQASAAEAHRLARIARTEAAIGVNEGRRSTIEDSVEAAGLAPADFVRVWCAKFCQRTCDFCAGAHGSIAPLGGSYPSGQEPGEVHPNCMCSEHILLLR